MREKIAIATMIGCNQGNRLQNYALQVILEEMTCKRVETLRVGYGPSFEKALAKKSLYRFFPKKRWARFEEFDSKYIHQSRWATTEPNLNESGYDLYVIGSDQVWNPTFAYTSDAEYLPQIPKAKKISYAASFGVNQIAENRERIGELLADIADISVREDAARSIVRDLCGIEAEVVLDPTMLLRAERWSAIAKKPDMAIPDGDYILKYVLGDNITDAKAERVSGLENCRIIDLKDRSHPVGPAEFVWLIANASYVCTDSFHASAFSVLMHTPFAIFERVSVDKDMSSRFDTLCRILDLGGRRVCERSFVSNDIDWAAVDVRLNSAYKRSFAFLRRCVDVSSIR